MVTCFTPVSATHISTSVASLCLSPDAKLRTRRCFNGGRGSVAQRICCRSSACFAIPLTLSPDVRYRDTLRVRVARESPDASGRHVEPRWRAPRTALHVRLLWSIYERVPTVQIRVESLVADGDRTPPIPATYGLHCWHLDTATSCDGSETLVKRSSRVITPVRPPVHSPSSARPSSFRGRPAILTS